MKPLPAAGAAPDRFALAWVRAPGAERCPSSQELHHLLEDTVGSVLVTPPSATVLIDGVVAPLPEGPGHRVLVRATTADGAPVGERRLESPEPECTDITRSALLVLAVLINPDAVADGLPAQVEAALGKTAEPDAKSAEPAPSAPPTIAPGPDLPSEARADQARADAPDSLDHAIAVHLAANVELTPSPMLGIAAAGHVALGDTWALELAAAFFPAADVEISGPYANGTVGFAAAELTPALCLPWRPQGTLELLPCAGGVAGVRFVVPNVEGFAASSSPRVYLGPATSLDFAWYPTRFAFLGARAQAAFLPMDHRFVYADHDGSTKVLFDPGPVAAYAGLGAGGAW